MNVCGRYGPHHDGEWVMRVYHSRKCDVEDSRSDYSNVNMKMLVILLQNSGVWPTDPSAKSTTKLRRRKSDLFCSSSCMMSSPDSVNLLCHQAYLFLAASVGCGVEKTFCGCSRAFFFFLFLFFSDSRESFDHADWQEGISANRRGKCAVLALASTK